jgi:hypothetical protein
MSGRSDDETTAQRGTGNVAAPQAPPPHDPAAERAERLNAIYGPMERSLSALGARLRHEPALAATFGYVFLVLLGGTNRALYFRRLGINIFDYAEPSDFFIAVFRDPVPIGYGALGMLIPIVIMAIARKYGWGVAFWKRRRSLGLTLDAQVEARLGPLGLMAYYAVLLLFLFGMFADDAAIASARAIREGRGEQITIVPTAAGAFPGVTEPGPIRTEFVAQTRSWLFVYQAKDKQIVAIPTQNLASIIRDVRPGR